MQMVGHDDGFMQHEFALLCIVLEHIDHDLRRGMLAEDRGSFPCDRSDENVLSKFIPEPYRPAHTKSVILEQKSMARSRMDRFCSKAAASTWKSGSHAEEAVLYERAALCGRASL